MQKVVGLKPTDSKISSSQFIPFTEIECEQWFLKLIKKYKNSEKTQMFKGLNM